MSSEDAPPATSSADAPPSTETSTTAPVADAPPAESSAAAAQVDGASEAGKGSALQEPEVNVEVKLADLQADPNNPLYSAQSFEQLDLYRPLPYHVHALTTTDLVLTGS